MSDKRRIAKNTIFLYFRMFFIMGAMLYASRIILKTLGDEDYGLYNVVGGVITVFAFLTGSLAGASSRYMTFELGRNDLERLNTVFNTSLLLHLALSAVILVLAETVGLWFVKNRLVIPADRMTAALWVYQATIAACIITMCQVPYNSMIIAYENMKIYAWGGIIEALLQLGIALGLFVLPGDKLILYAWLLMLVKLIVLLFYAIYVHLRFQASRFRFDRNWNSYREMIGYTCSDMIGGVASIAQGQGLNILLNMFFGPVVNAARGIVFQVQAAVMQFNNNFMTAVKPQIIKAYAIGCVDEMMRLFIYGSCISFYLTWLIALPLFLETDFVLTMWLGQYPEHTVIFLHLILIMCLMQAVKTPRSTVYHAMARLKLPNIVAGSILCSALPLAYFFLRAGFRPESVFWAANITMALSEVASVVILKIYLRRSITDYLVRVYVKCAAITAITFVAAGMVFRHIERMEASFLRLIITCVVTSAVIGITVMAVDNNVRNKTKDIILRKLHR